MLRKCDKCASMAVRNVTQLNFVVNIWTKKEEKFDENKLSSSFHSFTQN